MRSARLLLAIGAALMVVGPESSAERLQPAQAMTLETLGVSANGAFFYYADVDRAARFYTEVLGVRLVADYGFAKILRLAPSSFLTLVDATKGMHSADEPKTTAVALVTDQLDEWHAHATAKGVPLRGQYRPSAGSAHDGFVAVDPEGYFLEFERFNAHDENRRLTPVLAKLPTVEVAPGSSVTPNRFGFKATVLWLYYKDLAAAQRFYEDRLGFELIVDQGWAKIYQTSRSGFIGLVDQARGMHRSTEKKGVTVSFVTEALDRWFALVKERGLFTLRSAAVHQDPEGRYRAFVGYDPEGYYLEFDVFLPHPRNSALLEALGQ